MRAYAKSVDAEHIADATSSACSSRRSAVSSASALSLSQRSSRFRCHKLSFRVARSRLGLRGGWREQDLLQCRLRPGEWREQHAEIGFLAGRTTALHKAIGEKHDAGELGEGGLHQLAGLVLDDNHILTGVEARPASGTRAFGVARPSIGAPLLACRRIEIDRILS